MSGDSRSVSPDRRVASPPRVSSGLILLSAVAGAACAGSAPVPSGPAPPGVLRTALPPIPRVTGLLAVHVEYPDSLRRIAASDSNFVFGTVGTGDATLLIDGTFVEVEPNGAFLAWLPVPSPEAGDTARYHLVARRGTEVDTLSHPILLPPPRFEGSAGVPWIDAASVTVGTERWAEPDEPLTLVMRAAPHMSAWIESGARRFPLVETFSGRYRTAIRAEEIHLAACSADLCGVRDETIPLPFRFVVATESDTAVVGAEMALRLLDPARLPVAELFQAPDSVNGNADRVVGRPIPFGPYRWRFPDGTRATVDGRVGDRLRLRLAPELHAWVEEDDVRILPPATPPPRTSVGDLGFTVLSDRIELRLALSAPVPVQVEEPDPGTVALSLFGALGNTNRIALGPGSRVVSSADWMQLPGGVYRLVVQLAEPVWGYRTRYRTRPDGRAELLFEIRRVPEVDPAVPLAGRRIAIDPGHPGAGAHGPTGYYEGDANLAIGRILRRLLVEAGAEPILIRDDTLPMGLYERTEAARRAGAEAYVSIHNNALPDGVRPFGREGTSTYYYHPHSARLAGTVQEGMLATMKLRDLGVYWGDLAVCRMSWMPSVLTEGAFMMMPAHEAALRDPGFQELYARGVLEGLRRFFGSVAGRRAR